MKKIFQFHLFKFHIALDFNEISLNFYQKIDSRLVFEHRSINFQDDLSFKMRLSGLTYRILYKIKNFSALLIPSPYLNS